MVVEAQRSERMVAEQRVAVITGGASGIGLAVARLLALRGWALVLADVEAPRLEEAAQELTATELLPVVTDVRKRESVVELADRTYQRFGRADVLFNNAGVSVKGPVAQMSHDDWRWVVEVNLWGPIHGVEVFLPRILEAGRGGHLLFTSSFAGLVPNVGLGPYCVTKYGVLALAEVLYRELRHSKIGVSVLCPMRVKTDIFTSHRNRPSEFGGPEPAAAAALGPQDPELAGALLPVETVAQRAVDAIGTSRLYILPHEESRAMIRRRFDRIDRAFDETDP